MGHVVTAPGCCFIDLLRLLHERKGLYMLDYAHHWHAQVSYILMFMRHCLCICGHTCFLFACDSCTLFVCVLSCVVGVYLYPWASGNIPQYRVEANKGQINHGGNCTSYHLPHPYVFFSLPERLSALTHGRFSNQ